MSRSVWIKRVVCIIIALALIFIGYFYKKDTDNIPTDFYIGVIRTTEQKQSTVLSFYDKNLNCVGTKKLKYGLVGDTWRKPFCKDNHMYVNAAGLGGKKNLGISLDIDFNKRTINEFKHGLVGPADCVEADDYIFVCNNLNYKSNIVRCDKKSGNVIKFTDDISTLDTLYCYDKTLIAFGSDYRSSTKCYIYVMDFNLNLLKKIDISQLGYGVKNVELYEGIDTAGAEGH